MNDRDREIKRRPVTSNGYFINCRWKNGTTGIKWKKKKKKRKRTHTQQWDHFGRHRASPSIKHHRATRYCCTYARRRRLLRKRMHSHCCCYNCAEWALFFILSNTTTAIATNSNKKKTNMPYSLSGQHKLNFLKLSRTRKGSHWKFECEWHIIRWFFFFTCIILPLNWSHT